MMYSELDVWKASRNLVKQIYIISEGFPKSELYGLVNQVRRSSVSVPSNIAEGCGRRSSKDTLQFLYISRGSLYELETQIYLALDLGFMNQDEFDTIQNSITKCKKLLNEFINYYKTKS